MSSSKQDKKMSESKEEVTPDIIQNTLSNIFNYVKKNKTITKEQFKFIEGYLNKSPISAVEFLSKTQNELPELFYFILEHQDEIKDLHDLIVYIPKLSQPKLEDIWKPISYNETIKYKNIDKYCICEYKSKIHCISTPRINSKHNVVIIDKYDINTSIGTFYIYLIQTIHNTSMLVIKFFYKNIVEYEFETSDLKLYYVLTTTRNSNRKDMINIKFLDIYKIDISFCDYLQNKYTLPFTYTNLNQYGLHTVINNDYNKDFKDEEHLDIYKFIFGNKNCKSPGVVCYNEPDIIEDAFIVDKCDIQQELDNLENIIGKIIKLRKFYNSYTLPKKFDTLEYVKNDINLSSRVRINRLKQKVILKCKLQYNKKIYTFSSEDDIDHIYYYLLYNTKINVNKKYDNKILITIFGKFGDYINLLLKEE